jgi:hypothetical protein
MKFCRSLLSLVARLAPPFLDDHPSFRNMPPNLRLISFIVFIASAAAAAIGLAFFAQDALDLSRHAVRTDALLTAASIGGVMVLLGYSDRFGKK